MYKELDRLQERLAAYIEATYHASHPLLVQQRGALLRAPQVLAQRPFIEATPRYKARRRFAELELTEPIRALLTRLGQPGLLFDPPYDHQAQALEAVLRDGADLLVTTGTGSGKTETFLLPLLARLYGEAHDRPVQFRRRAVRGLILYPMNALVNDQLNRLRVLLGHPEVVGAFCERAGRPAKFGRYTGRTLFPGVLPGPSQTGKLNERLRPLQFYLKLLEQADGTDERAESARALIHVLKTGGRWPAKADLARWYWGSRGRRWYVDGALARTVEDLEGDAELLLRHEVQAAPPDLLLTNYSMLEYMLLRPLERSIWEATRAYYEDHPQERLLLVLDEAHLYRGATGAEVALLLRRLRHRLGLGVERVQVICTSASFEDEDRALEFIAALTGKPRGGIQRLRGEKVAHRPSGPVNGAVAVALSQVRLSGLHAGTARARAEAAAPALAALASAGRPADITLTAAVAAPVGIWALRTDGALVRVELPPGETRLPGPWLALVDVEPPPTGAARLSLAGDAPVLRVEGGHAELLRDPLQAPLYRALRGLPVVGRLLNLCSGARCDEDPETAEGGPQEVRALAARLFPGEPAARAEAATDALIELASLARDPAEDRPLLAARAHAFFRGIPGLWACLDPGCSALAPELRGGPTGRLYVQPRDRCLCGARALELHTCRDCGLAVAVGYAARPERPALLWTEPGEQVGEGEDRPPALGAVHLVLEGPQPDLQSDWLDPRTGRLGVAQGAPREVWRAGMAPSRPREPNPAPGRLPSCPRCKAKGEKISGHMTSGDEPFQQLVSVQLLTQPPRPELRTPLRGRKVMIFSDGRQKASRLAGNLQAFALRDATRPLLLDGFRLLQDTVGLKPTLEHSYLALLLGAARRQVRLPSAAPLRGALLDHMQKARGLLERPDAQSAAELSAGIRDHVPQDLIQAIHGVLFHPFTGVEALGLAGFAAEVPRAGAGDLRRLPAPPSAPAGVDAATALLDRWVQLAAASKMLTLPGVPAERIAAAEGSWVYRKSGSFEGALKVDLGGSFARKHLGRGGAWQAWIGRHLADGPVTADGLVVSPARVRLVLPPALELRRCRTCARVQRLNLLTAHCAACQQPALEPLDPSAEPRFRARAAFYREDVEHAVDDLEFSPHPFVSAEHSAAISQAMEEDLFARTEENELRFQDIPIPDDRGEPQPPVDVLSCTTTMEVGVDIGSLTGVALRNVPPGRANYQQRAGRAGRRGSALATVITYAGADGHDQRFFEQPAEMIGGRVRDPVIQLHNPEVVRRHAYALLLTMFQLEVLTDTGAVGPNVFMSLGTLREFREGPEGGLSYRGLAEWLHERRDEVLAALEELLPEGLLNRDEEVEGMPERLLGALRGAGAGPEEASQEPLSQGAALSQAEAGPRYNLEEDLDDYGSAGGAPVAPEVMVSPEHEAAALDPEQLLDRLMSRAVLPRYAFPTDVVSFHVLDPETTSRFRRPRLRYAPQLGLVAALSQYAPGRDVWVDGLRWRSLAVWSPFWRDRRREWERMQLLLECGRCRFTLLRPRRQGLEVGESQDCSACGGQGTMLAERWLRPVGFAHPIQLPAGLPGAGDAAPTRVTRARLSAPSPSGGAALRQVGDRVWIWESREELVVTNTGMDGETTQRGFRHCPRCGSTEPDGWPEGRLKGGGGHPRPTPARAGEPELCDGRVTVVTLGCTFTTDLSLYRLRLPEGTRISPGSPTWDIALTSVAEALAAVARDALELDAGELAAEHRPAQTPRGRQGEEVELYLYDAVPGGAGYARRAAQLEGPDLLRRALALLEGCKEACSSSCYACLRSYQNRWMHGRLDRHMAADLLRCVLDGAAPTVSAARAAPHLAAMASWLQEDDHPARLEGGALWVGGVEVRLTHPFLPGAVPEAVRPVNLLVAQRALPDACRQALGEAVTAPLPARPDLPEDPCGTPAYLPDALVGGWAGAEPVGRFLCREAEPDDILLRVDTANLEDLREGERPVGLGRGVWALFKREDAAGVATLRSAGQRPALLVRSRGGFHATGRAWTLGLPSVTETGDGVPMITVRYKARRESARREQVSPDTIRLLASFRSVVG